MTDNSKEDSQIGINQEGDDYEEDDNLNNDLGMKSSRLEAKIKVQESQVQEIIKMLAQEFNIEEEDTCGQLEDEQVSEKSESKDTGFDEKTSSENNEGLNDKNLNNNNNSEFISNSQHHLTNPDSQLTIENLTKHNFETEPRNSLNISSRESDPKNNCESEEPSNDDDFDTIIYDQTEFLDNQTELKNYHDIVEFILKAKDFGANALDLSKKGLKKLPKELLELGELQVKTRFFYHD
jgi:hypothetical protein